MLTFFSRLRTARGFSVAEASVVLSAMTVLATTMAPAVNDYLAEARTIKAHSETATLANTFVRMVDHVGPAGRRAGGWATFDLLAGAGEVPVAADPIAADWTATSAGAGALDDHLITNRPEYPRSAGPGTRGWRGAYLQSVVVADPWGCRYAINTRALRPGEATDTVVISAGPDGQLATPFAKDGIVAGGDDIIALVSSGGY